MIYLSCVCFGNDYFLNLSGVKARLTLEGIGCDDLRKLDLDDRVVKAVLSEWAQDLCAFLLPHAQNFKADGILLAGGLSILFKTFLQDAFQTEKIGNSISFLFSEDAQSDTHSRMP